MASRQDRTWTQVGEGSIDLSFPTVILLHDAGRELREEPPIVLGAEPLVVGRAEECGLSLDDPRVSRRHAVIRSERGGQRVVLDDVSRNGSFVNGERLPGAELGDGDVVRVGDSFFMLRRTAPETEDAHVPSIVGRAPAIALLRRTVSIVAPTDATVLVSGDSGTGKELVARAVHELSGRPGAFVPVNCSAIPATLAESHLFGHVAGSFTGAQTDHDGFFRSAHGGTLFLDEVGELPAEVQPKLLRVLEESLITPVGAAVGVEVDVRVVAATNRDLELAVDEGRFRGDVYARLAEITIRTPPLAERREDILPLFRLGYGEEPPSLAPDLVEALLLHGWRFNVRELFKVAKELRIKGGDADRLELRLVDHRLSAAPPGDPAASPDPARELRALAKRPPAPSKSVLEAMLRECGGNVSKLARLLGRSRRQVYRYLDEYDLDIDNYRDS